MKIRSMTRWFAVLLVSAASMLAGAARAADEAPDVFIKRLSTEVLQLIKTDKSIQSGEVDRIVALVDAKVMPNVNFDRMAASAIGPAWRKATPEQKKRLQVEFKNLLVRTYAGALTEIGNQTVVVKPVRAAADDKEVVVRSEVAGQGDVIQLDYRLEKTPGQGSGWKIYNLNVLGVWMVETYRNQFRPVINEKGLDGLISTLAERNKTNARDR